MGADPHPLHEAPYERAVALLLWVWDPARWLELDARIVLAGGAGLEALADDFGRLTAVVETYLLTEYEDGVLRDLDETVLRVLRGEQTRPTRQPDPVPDDSPGTNIAGLMAAMKTGVVKR